MNKPRSTSLFMLMPLLIILSLAACKQETPTTKNITPATITINPQNGYPAPGYPAPLNQETNLQPTPLEVSEIPIFPGRLAFHSDRSGILQIYVMNGSTSIVEPLVVWPNQVFEASWAPDCQSLAFSAGPGENDGYDIYVSIGDKSASQSMVANRALLDWSPAWSPNEDIIAFQNNSGGLINICFTNADGEDLGCLENDNFSNAMPSWSSDGSKLAFGSNRDGNWEIFLTDFPITGEVTQLTDNEGVNFHPRFSPDNHSIVFASQRLGNFDIYKINSDGSGEMQLTSDPAEDTTPVWVGNDKIAFSSNLTQDFELYLMDADGSNIQRLTVQTGTDQWPAWCQLEEPE